jgi:dienelactone hydrolase
MKITLAPAKFLLLLMTLGSMSGARADELVLVALHRTAASPSNPEATLPLLGFLTRPNGAGRFPAVVLLHSCGGFSGHDTEAAATLKSWGYVALAIDSLGDANVCAKAGGTAAEVFDANAALRYLTAQSFVAGGRIAIMGYSMGATAALATVEKGSVWAAEQPSFRAVVAYYPLCQFSSGVLTAPALVLVGEQDDWDLAHTCRKLAAHESDIGMTRGSATATPIDLVVYPEATHAFDMRRPPFRDRGHFEQYNEAAARDAAARVRGFLREVIGEYPDSP